MTSAVIDYSSARSFAMQSATTTIREFLSDKLVLAVFALLSIGLVMVASSSLDYAANHFNDPWYFARKQFIFVGIGFVCAFVLALVPIHVWQKYSLLLLLFCLSLLVIVLVPGIGKMVNGSRRWLDLGFVSVQASEIAKFCLVIYFASFMCRRQEELKSSWNVFINLICVLVLSSVLLLAEPDFGSTVVIALTLGAMMFVAGLPLLRFVLLAIVGAAGLAYLATYSPYRWERLITFMDPWSRQFDSGYQLVQSLIAFGRGEWFGLGLGNSLQKLFFLPEAHTDFVFAILAEEFGLIGALIVIGLFVFVVLKMLRIALAAQKKGHIFKAYLVFGFAIMTGVQVFINIGVCAGLLPTKGLTLPYISYGGSSMLISIAMLTLVLRVNWENKFVR